MRNSALTYFVKWLPADRQEGLSNDQLSAPRCTLSWQYLDARNNKLFGFSRFAIITITKKSGYSETTTQHYTYKPDSEPFVFLALINNEMQRTFQKYFLSKANFLKTI